ADVVTPEHNDIWPPSGGRNLRRRLRDRDGIARPNHGCCRERSTTKEDPPSVEGARALFCSITSVPVAHAILLCLTTQRKPRWLVDVSTACAWRAAGR